jgi:hypothetical protein
VTLAICSLAFPLVLALLSAGAGLLVERLAGVRLRTSLLLPCGFALIVAVTTVATLSGSTAALATPAVVVIAAAGLLAGVRRRPWPVSWVGVAAVVGVFVVASAPTVLTGDATFAGYTQLDDISTFLAFASRAIGHGRDLAGLQPSTYEATLAVNFRSGYPLGSFVPLSAARPLVGQDLAWLWQPYLTYILCMLALSVWALASEAIRAVRLRAAAVFLAAQPALLYAYALQGGVKELATAALCALGAALGADLLQPPVRARLLLPLGLAAVALLCVLNVGAAAYVGPLAVLVAARLPFVWRRSRARARPADPARGSPRRRALAVGALAAVTVALAIPVLSTTSNFVTSGGGLLQNKTDIGNLFHPLDWKQVLGIWPAGDFRGGIGAGKGLAYLLMAVLGVFALGGIGWALRRRLIGPLLFAGVVLGALAGLATFGSSPWVDAKALAIASPAVVLLALIGAAALTSLPRIRVAGAAALVAIGAGVLWSNWLAYHDVKLAPRDRFAELATIGDRFAGQGPALINEYEPYGARYFLRRLDPEAPAELRRRVVPLRTGAALGKAQWAPLDEFELPALLVYRTIVVRRSPAESRPPAMYSLRWSGRYYDVWQRPQAVRQQVLSYSVFGDQHDAAALPPCALVRRLAAVARRGGAALEAAVRAPAVVATPVSADRPADWPASADSVFPSHPGTVRLSLSVPHTGVHDVWVEGSFARGLEVSVDGARVGSTRDELSFAGQWIRFGARTLTAGAHSVALRYPGASLRPGGGQQFETVGPVALVPREPRTALVRVAPAAAASLCTKPLDWLEVVKG